MKSADREFQTHESGCVRNLFRLHNSCVTFEGVLIQPELIHKEMVERVQVSLEEFHKEWIEYKRKKAKEKGEQFNFSRWVRDKIEEEANDAPAYL